MNKEKIQKDLYDQCAVLAMKVDDVLNYLANTKQVSSANLQIRFKLGYHQADRVMAVLERHAIVSTKDGSKARTVLITLKDL